MRSSWLLAALLALTVFIPSPAAAAGCSWNGDAVYIDTNGDAVVSAGDVRITASGPSAAGSRVGGESDAGAPLMPLAGGFAFFDVNGDGGLSTGDRPFWDRTNPGPSVADILLADFPRSDGSTLPFGYVLGSNVGLGGFNVMAWPVAPVFDFFDEDGDGVVDRDDAVYAVQTAGMTRSKDVRISAGGSGATADGTLITGTANDNNLPLAGAAMPIMFADLDGSGAFGYPSGAAWTGSGCPGAEPTPVTPTGTTPTVTVATPPTATTIVDQCPNFGSCTTPTTSSTPTVTPADKKSPGLALAALSLGVLAAVALRRR